MILIIDLIFPETKIASLMVKSSWKTKTKQKTQNVKQFLTNESVESEFNYCEKNTQMQLYT